MKSPPIKLIWITVFFILALVSGVWIKKRCIHNYYGSTICYGSEDRNCVSPEIAPPYKFAHIQEIPNASVTYLFSIPVLTKIYLYKTGGMYLEEIGEAKLYWPNKSAIIQGFGHLSCEYYSKLGTRFLAIKMEQVKTNFWVRLVSDEP